MKKWIIKEGNKYLIFKRYVKFGDVIVVVEQTDVMPLATQFDSMDDVNACLTEIQNYNTYDMTHCELMEVKYE